MNKHSPVHYATSYDVDYFLWSQRQAELIRKLKMEGLDAENVAEEIESLGRRDRSKLKSQTSRLISHLLKWEFQPQRRGTSWRLSIEDAREVIEAIVTESPSLHRELKESLPAYYANGRRRAAIETKMPESRFPDECPYSEAQLLDWNFLPV